MGEKIGNDRGTQICTKHTVNVIILPSLCRCIDVSIYINYYMHSTQIYISVIILQYLVYSYVLPTIYMFV